MPALAVHKKKPRQQRRRRGVTLAVTLAVAGIAAAVVGWRVLQPGNGHAG